MGLFFDGGFECCTARNPAHFFTPRGGKMRDTGNEVGARPLNP